MKKRIKLIPLIVVGLVLILSKGCKKEENKSQIEYRTVSDIDDNSYKTVKIGNQVWMAENLKTTKYRNGDPIPNITDNTQWINLIVGAYCWYNNDINNKNPYGALYNWYAIIDSRNICPTGWHVPSDPEWKTLIDYTGGSVSAAWKLKETGTTHWQESGAGNLEGVTNETGFTALPSGARSSNGGFGDLGVRGGWWYAPQVTAPYHWSIRMVYDYSYVEYAYCNGPEGISVRCIKD